MWTINAHGDCLSQVASRELAGLEKKLRETEQEMEKMKEEHEVRPFSTQFHCFVVWWRQE